ncbi:hypothetical protein T484DRAFT_1903153, partial [Baffinella frigidus]
MTAQTGLDKVGFGIKKAKAAVTVIKLGLRMGGDGGSKLGKMAMLGLGGSEGPKLSGKMAMLASLGGGAKIQVADTPVPDTPWDTQGEEEAELAYWGDKGETESSGKKGVKLWQLWNKRAKNARPREPPREVPLDQLSEWVYAIFELKALSDVDAQHRPLGEFRTVEETLFSYLDEKYASSGVADLAAFDILTAVDQSANPGVADLAAFAIITAVDQIAAGVR